MVFFIYHSLGDLPGKVQELLGALDLLIHGFALKLLKPFDF